jgi:hypothetical protein
VIDARPINNKISGVEFRMFFEAKTEARNGAKKVGKK